MQMRVGCKGKGRCSFTLLGCAWQPRQYDYSECRGRKRRQAHSSSPSSWATAILRACGNLEVCPPLPKHEGACLVSVCLSACLARLDPAAVNLLHGVMCVCVLFLFLWLFFFGIFLCIVACLFTRCGWLCVLLCLPLFSIRITSIYPRKYGNVSRLVPAVLYDGIFHDICGKQPRELDI